MSVDKESIFIEVSKCIEYDPETGSMTWIKREPKTRGDKIWNTRFAGKECGGDSRGYRRIFFCSETGEKASIRAHRLAWFMYYGVMPTMQIDHINQNKADNRISNLREVTNSENQRNIKLPSTNKSGVIGVYWHSIGKKWCAQVKVNDVQHYLGMYSDIKEAEKVVKEFRSQHGFTENHGRKAA